MSEFEPVSRPQTFEPCEECGAPMDPQQRYCVNCAARRGNGANPSSRYFAMMSKRARRPLAGRAAKQSPTSRAAAVAFFALLPLAVGLGLVVGRSGSDGESNSDALLQALSERPAAAAGTVAVGTTPAAQNAKKGAKGGKDKAATKGEGKVTHTDNGDVHQITNFEASPEKEAEDTRIVAENPEQVGDDYIKAQQNLPDVIVVGGDGGSAPAPSGVEP